MAARLCELTVAIIALLSWLLLDQSGDIVVAMANLIAAGLQFAFDGGFTGSADETSPHSPARPNLSAQTRDAFLYVVWVVVLVVAYLATGWIIPDKKSEKNGWSIILGVLNGFLLRHGFPAQPWHLSHPTEASDLDAGLDLLAMMGRA